MGKSTSDTFRDLFGGITDDIKEAFDDIIDYDECERRGYRDHRGHSGGHWRQREDDGYWHGRRGDRREDDRWFPRESGERFEPGDGYDGRERDARRAADHLTRQSRRHEEADREVARDLRELRTDLTSVVEALRQTTAALKVSTAAQEPNRT